MSPAEATDLKKVKEAITACRWNDTIVLGTLLYLNSWHQDAETRIIDRGGAGPIRFRRFPAS